MSQSEATANACAGQVRRCEGKVVGLNHAHSAKTVALGQAQLRPLARLIAVSLVRSWPIDDNDQSRKMNAERMTS